MCSCAVLDIINEKIIIQNKKKLKKIFRSPKKYVAHFKLINKKDAIR